MKIYIALMILCFCGLFLFPVEVTKPMLWSFGPMVLDSQGNIFFGYDEHSIVKFSPKGEELLKMGQEGAGPSDIKRLCSYAFNPKDNSIYVTEYYEGNRWVSRFTTDGKFAGIWKFDLDWTKYEVVSSIAFDSLGNVYVETETREIIEKSDYQVSIHKSDILKFSSTGKYLGLIYSFKTPSDGYSRSNFTIRIPFSNRLAWKIYQDKIIIKELSGDCIKIYSTNGKLEKQIPFPIKRVKVTEKDLDNWEKWVNTLPSYKNLLNRGFGSVKKWRDRLPFPEYKPNSGGFVIFDSKKNMYISEYIDPGVEKEYYVYFKINLDSGKMEKVQFKSGYSLMLIKDNYYYFSKYYEDEDNDTIYKVSEQELKTW